MASSQIESIPAKLSFAKVAAMKVPNPTPPPKSLSEETKSASSDDTGRRKTVVSARPAIPSAPVRSFEPQNELDMKTPQAVLAIPAIDHLNIADQSSHIANGTKSAGSGDSAGDDQSHLSNSSTKQHSFDTKSMASVTTFAMDEKESILPDDSASVRAADEEDLGSTLGRNNLFQTEPDVIMPVLRGGRSTAQNPALAVRRFHTLTNPPQFGSLQGPVPVGPDELETTISGEPTEASNVEHERPTAPPVPPYEKLLDALASPKERLPLLQLEERLLHFMHQSTLPYIDLPPQHSYARLLAHKLADYYNLQHHINEDGTSIRVYHATANNLPTSLANLAKSIPVGSNQAPGLTAVKIMRRAGMPRQFSTTESTAPSSSAPSKATSEAGHSEEGLFSPTEASTPSRDRAKLTREEREAQYKAARERIFGSMDELSLVENHSTGENSASMSRSSSSSGKKKNRKAKAPKDDSFDSRSAFVASYGPMHVQQVPSFPPQQYIEASYQAPYDGFSPTYASPAVYSSTPTQTYPGFDQSMQYSSPADYGATPLQSFASMDGWSSMPQPSPGAYGGTQQQNGGYHQNMAPVMGQMNNQFQAPSPANLQHPQNWAPPYANPYQQAPNQQGPNMDWQSYQSYQPQQMQGVLMQNQYPLHQQQVFPVRKPQPPQPSHSSVTRNYNKPGTLFNPQTKTFVPSNGPSRGHSKQGRKKYSPNSTNHSSRQNSMGMVHTSNSVASPLFSPGRPEPVALHAIADDRSGQDSLQQRYGKPANLPKKPPPSKPVSQFDANTIQGVRNISNPLSASSSVTEVKE